MIGRLQGKIVEKHPPELLLDVNGVGYELQCSMNTFYQLPDVGEEVTLYAHLIVREDAHVLYGFYDLQERALFKELIKVNGVGPKIAITILSSIAPNIFLQLIAAEDINSLIKMPGIGRKTAERLIVEMKDRLQNILTQMSPSKTSTKKLESLVNQVIQDAMSALIALGYKPQEASRAISKVSKEDMGSEEMIRLALQSMVK